MNCGAPRTGINGICLYLNRLHEFCTRGFDADASRSLSRAEFDYLAAFVRRLNEVASKGVHAQVTVLEARQGLLGVYVFLSNVIAKLTTSEGATE